MARAFRARPKSSVCRPSLPLWARWQGSKQRPKLPTGRLWALLVPCHRAQSAKSRCGSIDGMGPLPAMGKKQLRQVLEPQWHPRPSGAAPISPHRRAAQRRRRAADNVACSGYDPLAVSRLQPASAVRRASLPMGGQEGSSKSALRWQSKTAMLHHSGFEINLTNIKRHYAALKNIVFEQNLDPPQDPP